MKTIARDKIRPICIDKGDTLALEYEKRITFPDGDYEIIEREKVLEATIDREMTLDEAVIFNVEEGDFEGASDGIGGAFLSSSKED